MTPENSRLFREWAKAIIDKETAKLLEGEPIVPDIDRKNTDWANVVQATKKAMRRTRITTTQRLIITANDANLSCLIGENWRKRRFYQGDSFAWRDVRHRRNGGMLFVMADHAFMEGRSRAGYGSNAEVFSAIEAEYPQMCETFAGFDSLFKSVVGVPYDEMLACWKLNGVAVTSVILDDIAVPAAAPPERHVLMPDWGSW